jgi:hypothetical protein
MRTQMRSLFVELAEKADLKDAAQLGNQLSMLYDGAGVGAAQEGGTAAITMARAIAKSLLDAAAHSRARSE